MKKSVLPFDDQHQPMSTWLDDLAVKEASTYKDADLTEDEVGEGRKVEFKGISSTWNKKGLDISKGSTDDHSRQIENRVKIEASIDEIEKEARKLLMSGFSIEKVSSKIKKQFEGENTKAFFTTKFASLESEFGKLGYIYLDPTLVSDCKELNTINVNQKISSIALKNIKTAKQCGNCNFNKHNNCVLVGLKLSNEPKISSQQEAKFVLNKFASQNYVNNMFIKTADLVAYYDRLRTDSPEKVVSDFLFDIDNRRFKALNDINNRRFKSANTDNRVDTTNRPIKLENKQAKDVWGMQDQEVANAFKQLLVKTQSIRIAKSTLVQRYGEDRMTQYLKEAKNDLRKFVRFITSKKHSANVRLESSDKESEGHKISSANNDVRKNIKLQNALKLIYASVICNKLESDTRKHMLRAFDESIVEEAFNVFASEKGSKKQAGEILCYAAEEHYLDTKIAKKILAKLDSSNNNLEIVKKAFEVSRDKKISDNLKDQIVNTALKYASDSEVSQIRKLSTKSWTSKDELIQKLKGNLKFASYFTKDVNIIIDKSANDASTMLQTTNLFDDQKSQENLPDPMLFAAF